MSEPTAATDTPTSLLGHARRDDAVLALALMAQLALLGWDATTPLGKTEWVLQMLPITLAMLQRRRWVPVLLGVLGIAWLGLGFVLSSPSTDAINAQALLNRVVGAVCIAVIVAIVLVVLGEREQARRALWVRQGEAALAQRLVSDESPEALGDAICDTLCRWLRADLAVMYRRDGAQLVPCGSHAVDTATQQAWVAVGEGLLGQVAIDGRFRALSPAPAGHLKLHSGLGNGEPAHLLLMPLRAGGATVGIVELGLVGAAPDLTQVQALADRIATTAGMALRSAIDSRERQALLAETQRQAAELQAQQEELRVNNEELEAQSNVLRESQSRLELQQSELEQAHSRLAVHAQTLELQKRELVRSRADLQQQTDALEAANRYKSEFLANMSHELRTPLNSSLILSRLLVDNKTGRLGDEEVRYAQAIHDSNNDLLVLINDILDLSKIEAGHADLRSETVRLADVASRMRSTFEPLARQKQLVLAIRLEPGAPATLQTDGQRLQQVLKNLLANAVKFTARGEVTMRVHGAPGGGARFEVRDTGPGIAADKLQIIFEAFRQADGSTSRQFGGTGLGLSISRELAQRMGGVIEVQSEPGQGSTFSVTLPAVMPEQAPPGTATPAPGRASAVALAASPAAAGPGGDAVPGSLPSPGAPAAQASSATTLTPSAPVTPTPLAATSADAPRPHGQRRVLMAVEDDSRFAAVLQQLIEEQGFDCVIAGTGEQALALARELHPAGILLDVGLPDQSGLAVLERLKRDPATRHVPVHMVSSQERSQAALELGAVGHVVKPAQREELVAAIRRLEDRLDQPLRRVLVVEDDEGLRANLQRLLSGPQVEIVTVGTVAAALEALRASTFDCMVTDLALPDASGFELLERMAERDEGGFPPVIVYTGRALSRDEETRLRRHSRSIIVKGARSPERLLDEVTLFLHSVEAQLPSEQQRLLSVARQRDAVLDGRRILLAEDDVRNIFALSSVFEPQGVKLDIARNGREAVDKVAALPDIDLVLMDVMMPEMDGLAAMRAIRARVGDELPIIALTAKAMADDRQQCLAAGANDYLAKPIDVDRLLSLCRVWMPK
jgi:signal transduction histidine kinase/CheY-like chemotaxis protein